MICQKDELLDELEDVTSSLTKIANTFQNILTIDIKSTQTTTIDDINMDMFVSLRATIHTDFFKLLIGNKILLYSLILKSYKVKLLNY